MRSKETLAAYDLLKNGEGIPTNLTERKRIRTFTHWFIAENDFPYDKIAKTHHILAPLRIFGDERDMRNEERHELTNLKELFGEEKTYDIIMENISHIRTVKGHYHLQLIAYKT